MKDQRPDKQVESSITGGACSARSQFHKAPVYIMEEGSAVPAGLRATQIKCTSCKIQRDPRARARANGSESHFRFLKTSTHRTFPLQLLPAAPLPSPRLSAARNSQRTDRERSAQRNSVSVARRISSRIVTKYPNLKKFDYLFFDCEGKVISRDKETILPLSKS